MPVLYVRVPGSLKRQAAKKAAAANMSLNAWAMRLSNDSKSSRRKDADKILFPRRP